VIAPSDVASYVNRMLVASTDRLTLDGVRAVPLSVAIDPTQADMAARWARRV